MNEKYKKIAKEILYVSIDKEYPTIIDEAIGMFKEVNELQGDSHIAAAISVMEELRPYVDFAVAILEANKILNNQDVKLDFNGIVDANELQLDFNKLVEKEINKLKDLINE